MQATYPLEAVPAALAKAAAGGMVSKIGITTDKLPPPPQHHQQQPPPPPQQRQQQQSLASRLPTKTDDTTTRAPPPPPQPGPIPQAALPPITVPHLTGVFVSLDDVTAARSLAGWQSDLSAMKHAGIEWFAIRSTAAGADEPPVSAECPLGGFRVFFPPGPHQQPPCFQPEHRGLDTIGTILAAAQTVGLQVHLGLGYPQTSR